MCAQGLLLRPPADEEVFSLENSNSQGRENIITTVFIGSSKSAIDGSTCSTAREFIGEEQQRKKGFFYAAPTNQLSVTTFEIKILDNLVGVSLRVRIILG